MDVLIYLHNQQQPIEGYIQDFNASAFAEKLNDNILFINLANHVVSRNLFQMVIPKNVENPNISVSVLNRPSVDLYSENTDMITLTNKLNQKKLFEAVGNAVFNLNAIQMVSAKAQSNE